MRLFRRTETKEEKNLRDIGGDQKLRILRKIVHFAPVEMPPSEPDTGGHVNIVDQADAPFLKPPEWPGAGQPPTEQS